MTDFLNLMFADMAAALPAFGGSLTAVAAFSLVVGGLIAVLVTAELSD
jgi:hypothetical protein